MPIDADFFENKSLDELYAHLRNLFRKYRPHQKREENLLRTAFLFGKEVHKNQTRESGAPYFSHPIAVASLLAQKKMSVAILVSALLHDAFEDSPDPHIRKKIQKTFGKEIASLIEGVSKTQETFDTNKQIQVAKTLRKMFSLAREDARILVIKIADRLHNMATLSGKNDPKKRRKKAEETAEIFIPLARRLGIFSFRNALENLCFRAISPEIYTEIEEQKRKMEKKAEDSFREFNQHLLRSSQFQAEKTSRQLSHIWKLQKESIKITPEDTFVASFWGESVAECFSLFADLKKIFFFHEGNFLNFFLTPRENGYRAIHATFIHKARSIRVHIMLKSDREKNENGILKDIEKGIFLSNIHGIVSDKNQKTEDFLRLLRRDILEKKITIHHKKKGGIFVPQNSSALDAAFFFFPEKTVFLKDITVSGKTVDFGERLKEGDILSFSFSEKNTIHPKWHSFLRSEQTALMLRMALKKEDQEKKKKIGAHFLQQEFDRFSLGNAAEKCEKETTIWKKFSAKNFSDLCFLVAEGIILPVEVVEFFSKPKKKSFWHNPFGLFSEKPEMRLEIIAPKKISITSVLNTFFQKYTIEPNKIHIEKSEKEKRAVLTITAENNTALSSFFLEISNSHSFLKTKTLLSPPFLRKIILLGSIFLLTWFLSLLPLFRSEWTREYIFLLTHPFFIFFMVFPVLFMNITLFRFLIRYVARFRKSSLFALAAVLANAIIIALYFLSFGIRNIGTQNLSFFLPTILFLFSSFFLLISFSRHILLFSHSTKSIPDWQQYQREKRKGYLFRISAILLFALHPLIIRYSLPDKSGIVITALAILVATLFSLPIFFYRYYQKKRTGIKSKQQSYSVLFWISILFDALLMGAYFLAAQKTSASNAILFLNFSPVFALLVALIFWRQKIIYLKKPENAIAIIIVFLTGLLGTLFLVMGKSDLLYSGSLSGDGFAFLAMIFDVIATIALIWYSKSRFSFCGIEYIFRKVFFLSLFLSPVSFYALTTLSFSSQEIWGILYSGIGVMFFAYWFAYEAYKRIDGFINFLLFNLAAVITVFIEIFFFHLPVSLLFIAGGILILASSVGAEWINTHCEKKQLEKKSIPFEGNTLELAVEKKWSEKKKQKIIGYAIRFAAVIIWGVQPLYLKYVLADITNLNIRIFLVSLGGLVASILIFQFLSLFAREKRETKIPFNINFFLLILGVVALHYTMNTALLYTSSTNLLLLGNFGPIVSLMLAFLFWRKDLPYFQERIHFYLIFLLFFLGCSGASLLFLNEFLENNTINFLGDSLATLTMFIDALLVVAQIRYARFLKEGQAPLLNICIHLGLVFLFLPMTLFYFPVLLNTSWQMILLSFFGGAFISLGYTLNYEAFRRIDGYIAFLMFNVSILITFVAEAYFLKTVPPTNVLLIGGFLILASSIGAEWINTHCEKKQLQKKLSE